MNDMMGIMTMPGVGFIGLLVVGFLAGWIAEKVMNRDHSLLNNIIVGVAGSFVGGSIAGLFGLQWYGFISNLIVATGGAILLLWFFGKREMSRSAQQRQNGFPDTARPKPNGFPKEKLDDEKSGRDFTPIYHSKDENK